MCENCGCSSENYIIGKENVNNLNLKNLNFSLANNLKVHLHEEKKIEIEQDVLYKNNLTAQKNRGYFEAKNIVCFNIVGSPGSGKTSILERFITEVKDLKKIYVIEGDQHSSLDATRIENLGVKVLQINTGTGCHLNANMIYEAIKKLNPDNNSLIFIENVGNLVCPSLFDLGENFRILVISVTEGEEKPLKYPYMFQSSHLCIINKVDLLPYLDLDISTLKENINKINHHLDILEISCKSNKNINLLVKWIENKCSI